jgi:ABC-type antimicrobial peptide transport system permease subunit
MAFKVERQTNEIGIRMALGASPSRVVRMVLGEVLVITTGGVVVGLGLSAVGARYIKSLLYAIEPGDPVTIGAAAAVLVICTLVAAFAPARRASRIDPMTAVRRE